MRNKMIAVLLILFSMFSVSDRAKGSDSGKTTGRIIVKVEGLSSSDGVVRSHLYNNSKDFPVECDRAFMKSVSKITNNSAQIVFENIPFGTYALTVHHDANNNGKMDKNFIGYPKEGFGVSNNPRIVLSIPTFEECKFTLNSEIKTIIVKLKFT